MAHRRCLYLGDLKAKIEAFDWIVIEIDKVMMSTVWQRPKASGRETRLRAFKHYGQWR